MTTVSGRTKDGLSFGPFSLFLSERLLTREGVPVALGARALDLLIALTSTPNEVVNKKDLISRVWPDVTVEEGSLRFHMTGLRKALGDGKDGSRYITTFAGRGYCFVAPILPLSSPRDFAPVDRANFSPANLPSRLTRMVGRDEDVLKLSDLVSASRFVTILGAGGVGKTTVAVAVAHHLAHVFDGAVLFVDLGMLSDPKLAATAVASMLGLSVQSEDATPGLIAFLKSKRILLILDTCEHLVEAIASLAARIVVAAPKVYILATSREALRVDGEHVYRLDPLACPPDTPGLTAAAVQQFPAAQLFVERAVAGGARLDISDAEAFIVADICRKLDGVALAIELAARRVESHGLHQTAALLEQRLTLPGLGSRTAPPRQKTLQATLDWSYELLSELERVVLRRLAIFVGHFTLDAALEIVTGGTLDQSAVFGAMDSLVAKSMVAARPIGAMVRYRLLDTTRAYAAHIPMAEDEFEDLAGRHAKYYMRWLEQIGAEWTDLSPGPERTPHFAALNNVRAALEWCFGDRGRAAVGVELAAAAAPVFLAMSLLPECVRWSERAIQELDGFTPESDEEMRLQAALGMCLMFTHGESEAARVALTRAFAISHGRGDAVSQVHVLGLLQLFHMRCGDFKASLDYAMRGSALARTIENPAAIASAHSNLGASLYLIGDLRGARAELEAALKYRSGSNPAVTVYLGFDHFNRAGINLARTLWFQGFPNQATARAHQTIKDSERMNHPVTLSIALVWAISVFLWTGDLESAQDLIDRFISHAESHSLGPYLTVGRGYEGVLAIQSGKAVHGVERIQGCLELLHAAHYELITTEFNIYLALGLLATGRSIEALALVDETIQLTEKNGDLCYMPELLRLSATTSLAMPQPDIKDAESRLMQSLHLSRSHGARAWELRAASNLAQLRVGQGRAHEARAVLVPVFEQFTEGLDTTDVKGAAAILRASA